MKKSKRQVSDYPVEEGNDENVKLLCCSFQKYLHCSESVVNTTCGYETAQFTKSFLDRMSGPLIQVIKMSSLHRRSLGHHFSLSLQGHCQAYEYGSNGCTPQGNLPWDEYNHYSAYNHGQRLDLSWPLLILFTLCAKLLR